MARRRRARENPIKTRDKLLIGGGAAVLLGGFIFLITRSSTSAGLNFNTRNLAALNAVVDKMIADPSLNASVLSQFADHLAYYGFAEQETKLRAKIPTAPKYTQQEIQSGITKLWEQQAKQGFW
jgi:hypothetical protein